MPLSHRVISQCGKWRSRETYSENAARTVGSGTFWLKCTRTNRHRHGWVVCVLNKRQVVFVSYATSHVKRDTPLFILFIFNFLIQAFFQLVLIGHWAGSLKPCSLTCYFYEWATEGSEWGTFSPEFHNEGKREPWPLSLPPNICALLSIVTQSWLAQGHLE